MGDQNETERTRSERVLAKRRGLPAVVDKETATWYVGGREIFKELQAREFIQPVVGTKYRRKTLETGLAQLEAVGSESAA